MRRLTKALSKTLMVVATSLVVVAVIAVVAYNFISASHNTTTTPQTQVLISGAGASFLAPQMLEWARVLTETKGIRVEYQSVGSGAGRDMFFNKVVHFAGSDPPLSKELYNKHKGEVMQIPVVVGSVVIIYNIPDPTGGNHVMLEW